MDINTIFYFPSSLTFEEYSYKLNQGEISERTIVFADAQKSIYKGGKRYGSITMQEFHDLADTLHGNSWISDELTTVRENILDSTTLLNRFYDTLTNTIHRLDHEIETRDENIQTKVEQLMDESEWLQEHFPQGVTQWDSRWDSDIEAYLSLVGYWTTDANNNKITQWSKLQQQADSISSSVSSLKDQGNLTEALTTSIQQLITGRIAQLELGTTYAKITKTNDIEKVIEWMYSGFKSQSSSDLTFSEMSSMAKNDFVSAISDIRTQVQKVANGDYVAQTELASKVGNVVSTMILQAANDNALAGMAARLNTVEQDTGTLSQNVASLVLGVTGSSSTANLSTVVANKLAGFTTSADIDAAKTEIYSAIGAKDGNNNFISIASLKTQADTNGSNISGIATRVGTLETNQAGFVASANLGSSVAEMFASSGNGQNATAKANVVALVKDNKSSLELTADDVSITANDININGYLTGGSASFKGSVEATSFSTGDANEIGICVVSGEFNQQLANTHKAYFAYDSSQGGITMWYYQNNEWKRLDLASSAVLDSAETFQQYTFYNIPDTSIKIVPDNLTTTTLYYNRITGKYYTTTDTTYPATGTYYDIPNYNKMITVPNGYKTSRSGSAMDAYGVCCVREIQRDGTRVQSGMLSEGALVGNIRQVVITNGTAVFSENTVQVFHAVVDVYYTGATNYSPRKLAYAVIAPVIVCQYDRTIWDDSSASYKSLGNTTSGYGRSTYKIALDGGVFRSSDNRHAATTNGYKMATLAYCLSEVYPDNWSITVGGTMGTSYAINVSPDYKVYVGDSNYPYPYTQAIPNQDPDGYSNPYNSFYA